MFPGANFVEEVQGLPIPILAIVAENDTGLGGASMQQAFLAWHPNAELLTIANCGHYPMQECPPHFVTVVERFLRKHVGQVRAFRPGEHRGGWAYFASGAVIGRASFHLNGRVSGITETSVVNLNGYFVPLA